MRSATFTTLITLASCQPYASVGKQPPAVSCPKGFTLIGKKCEQVITTPPIPLCATGALIGDLCTNFADFVKQCPIGTQLVGNEQCVVNNLRPAAQICPEGFADAGNAGCVQARPLPLIQVCDIGAMDVSGQCILVETAPKVIKTFCPPGFQDLGKGCEQAVEYDCTPPLPAGKGIPPPVAPLPSFPYKHAHKRMLGAKRYAVYAPRPVAAIPIPPPSKAALPPPPPPPPAPKISVLKQLCVRKDFAPPLSETYCPPGFTETGDKCVAKKSYPPTQKCSNGLPASECQEHLSAPKQLICHEGVLVGDQCQTKMYVPIEIVCPAGTHMVGEQCASYTKPSFACPPSHQLNGQQCIGRITAEPIGSVTVQCTGKECWQGLKH